MNLRKSSNPTLSQKVFDKASAGVTAEETMSINGTTNKTAIMLLIVVLSSVLTWGMVAKGSPNVSLYVGGGAIGGLITALITIFGNPKNATITAPLYALFEGLFLGGVSAWFEASYPGIVTNAVGLTFALFFFMLFAYKSQLIKPTRKFKAFIITSIGGIFFFYIMSIILGLFGINLHLFNYGFIGIGIQLFIVAIAALSFILDFEQIEKFSQQGAPKFMEWYSAFGLMVTLIWLYLEILRLLAIFARSD